LPKAVGRPVYSYRLSIVHFWALVFMYIWAGPHHLLYTALPEWAQSLGMVFSVMLWAPSWGGMLNGLLTLRGAWDKLRTDPVVKFLIAGVTFYGMATFEGPLLSIKSVSALAHYTDWIIGHVHTGALGWNGFMAAGMLYWLVPRLWGTELKSKAAADYHFWIATLGILLYAISMWVSGVTQGLMWRAVNTDGGLLYPNFVETLIAIRPMYITRLVGGSLYFVGYLLMAWNLVATIRSGKAVNVEVKVTEHERGPSVPVMQILLKPPMLVAVGIIVVTAAWIASSSAFSLIFLAAGIALAVITATLWRNREGQDGSTNYHRLLEGRPLLFTVLSVLAVIVGGVAELVPTIVIDKAVPKYGAIATPYRPLELHGRDIYVREGCYVCHSQMIRPFRDEFMRYGEISTAGEFIYDHPFQWGSKRTGPDLHRIGGKYPNLWHYQHMIDPRSTSPGSNMPEYKFMADRKIDVGDTVLKVKAMKTLGVPYSAAEVGNAAAEAEQMGRAISQDLAAQGVTMAWDTEMVALIAYLQRLGKHTPRPGGR
jgi:cytochrome c oxidase cbb3-type subunit I/II